MVCGGLGSMIYLFYQLLRPEHVGHPLLYLALMSTLFYFCLKIGHEWYHYMGISIPKKPEEAPEFTVDVLTTFCPGEPYDMIRNTLEAIQRIRYPHTTWLCDEANDPYLIELCDRLGVRHVTRDNRHNAKAGNINNALAQATGEICLILDPDHIPSEDFLDEIVPYFKDEKVGYVQTVQAYGNVHESLIARGAAQQTYQFYGPMMMSMQRYGTVQAIGANCTFRRSALDSIGGHAPGLAEDMHTAMLLQAKGWESVYVPKILTRGLVPSTLSAYYKQQLKWSRGVFELLFVTYPRIFGKLNWRQRLHFGTLPWFYIAGLFYLINFSLPVISLFSGVMPLRMDLGEFLLLGAPLFYSTLLIRHFSQHWLMEERERGFHVIGGFLLIGTWWIHTMGFVMAILRKKVPYDPTPKDGNEANNWPLNIPNMVVMLISISAVIYGLSTHQERHYYAMALMAGMNAFFMGFTVLASRQQSWRRSIEKRRETLLADHYIRQLRIKIWLFNHYLMRHFRRAAPLLLVLTTIMSFSMLSNKTSFKFSLLKDQKLAAALLEYQQRDSLFNGYPAELNVEQEGFGDFPNVRILKPAVVLFHYEKPIYHAAIKKDEEWTLANAQDSVALDWYMIRLDKRVSDYRIRHVGSGEKVQVSLPRKYENFRILLKASDGEHVRYQMDRMNTPLPKGALRKSAN